MYWGASVPPNVWASPQKVFPEKKLKAILNTDLIIKESMKVTNVQKFNFSQSWTLFFQNFPRGYAPDPSKRPNNFFLTAAWLQ